MADPQQPTQIPTRFEHVLTHKLDPAALIVPAERDLKKFESLRVSARVQGGGLLGLLTGSTGVGKTTGVYSAGIHMSDRFTAVVPVPPEVPLREVSAWLGGNLPAADSRTTLVLFDSREVSDDAVGLRQLLASLNGLLRTRPDVLFVWPTTDEEWREEIRSTARTIGGDSLVPDEAVITIEGPPKTVWMQAFEQLLIQLDVSLDDLALTTSRISELIEEAHVIGDFLASVRKSIAQQIEAVQVVRDLPKLLFVITSTSEVVGHANYLRRAGTFALKAEELLAYSARSRAGLWWAEHADEPQHNLGYICSLFTARLATMTPSAVAYACVEFGDDALKEGVRNAGVTRSSGNADRTLKNTDFYRYLAGQPITEMTSTRKGKTSAQVSAAYAWIQEQSSKRHKVINQAICALLDRNIDELDVSAARFEVDQGDRSLYADVVVPWRGDDVFFEFHHAKEPNAAKIAAYVMEKLQYYAIHYNLVPRA